MRCPNCDQSLRPCQYEGVTIHTCDGCHGEFVASEDLRTIVNTREAPLPERLLAEAESARPSFGAAVSDCDRALACPACDMPMDALNYAADTGVMIDRCPSCAGLWLDADELERIQAILERWEDQRPAATARLKPRLDAARRAAREASASTASFSRFDFISALVNRLLNRAA